MSRCELEPAVEVTKDGTDNSSGDHANQTRKNEGVIDHELADVGRTGAVELQSSQVRRVGRQDVVTVAGGDHGDCDAGRNTDLDSDRQNDGHSSGLRVHELGHDQQHHGVEPGVGRDSARQSNLQFRQVSLEEGVRHPRHAVHGSDSDSASAEHGALANVSSAGAAEDHHQSAGSQHHHLNDERHGHSLAAEHRTETLGSTEDSHDCHAPEEDPEGSPLRLEIGRAELQSMSR